MPGPLKLGIPKGSLQDVTLALFRRAGFDIRMAERSYRPSINDPEIECMLIRAQEMPRYVESGVIDIGITGIDWVEETGADVTEIADMIYSKSGIGSRVRLVIAVAAGSGIRSVQELNGKRVATELVNVTERYLESKGVKARVEFSWGATEAKIPDLADAICDITDTGASIMANNLIELDTVLESSTKIIANRNSIVDPWKSDKIKSVALLLGGALRAYDMVGLKMNIEKSRLDGLLSVLDSLTSPTVSNLSNGKFVAVEVAVDRMYARSVIPRLKSAGAIGIVEYPLNKIID